MIEVWHCRSLILIDLKEEGQPKDKKTKNIKKHQEKSKEKTPVEERDEIPRPVEKLEEVEQIQPEPVSVLF